ncbi:hypothetical protein LJR290_007999 [Variovorax sp. LjRoot290]|uniref:hypothetical protein n=1 Tax=Variovorax sp. LjRoot290 TaxID=3342316 RepID=UPI003ECF91C1
MANQIRFSAEERAALAAMLEAPEVIELHGNDTAWRHGLVGALMATAAMTFAPSAHADSPNLFERTLSSVASNAMATAVRQTVQGGFDAVGKTVKQAVNGDSANAQDLRNVTARPGTGAVSSSKPSLSSALGFGRSDLPQTTNDLAAVMERNDVASVASTSALRPVLFPVVVAQGQSEFSQFNDAAGRAVAAVPAGPGGQAFVRDGLMQSQQAGQGPMAVMYMGAAPNTAGCMIVMHAGKADYAQRMAQMTGLSMKEAMDFAVLHEAAHCAQQGETLAAQLEAGTGRGEQARQRTAYSGLVDVRTERAIQGGALRALAEPGMVDKTSRSAERYADAFAALAMNAQQPLSGQQWNGIGSWRMSAGSGHDTSNFVRWVQDQVQRDPIAREAMKSDSGAGFNAQAVAAFLKPIWKTFEAREMELDQNRQRTNQGYRPAERISQTSTFGARQSDAGGQARGVQREDPRGYTDEDMQTLLGGAPRPR